MKIHIKHEFSDDPAEFLYQVARMFAPPELEQEIARAWTQICDEREDVPDLPDVGGTGTISSAWPEGCATHTARWTG